MGGSKEIIADAKNPAKVWKILVSGDDFPYWKISLSRALCILL